MFEFFTPIKKKQVIVSLFINSNYLPCSCCWYEYVTKIKKEIADRQFRIGKTLKKKTKAYFSISWARNLKIVCIHSDILGERYFINNTAWDKFQLLWLSNLYSFFLFKKKMFSPIFVSGNHPKKIDLCLCVWSLLKHYNLIFGQPSFLVCPQFNLLEHNIDYLVLPIHFHIPNSFKSFMCR